MNPSFACVSCAAPTDAFAAYLPDSGVSLADAIQRATTAFVPEEDVRDRDKSAEWGEEAVCVCVCV